jgi:hypothetical protein
MLGVPDAVQRFFSGAPQSRDPFPLVVENMLAAGVAQCGQGVGVPSIPLGMLRKNTSSDPG